MTSTTHRLPVTALIAAKNESENLPRCLAALTRMERVVVVDSLSVDGTAEIAERLGAEVIQFEYTGGYPKKRQWALGAAAIDTPWVLLLDADEIAPAALVDEMASAIACTDALNGYFVTKGFHFLGRRFRFGGFSHDAVALVRNGKARFERLVNDSPGDLDMEVHERLIVDGPVGRLLTPLIHDDRKGLEAYVEKHRKYSTWEARVRRQFLETGRWGEEAISPRVFGNVQERRRRLKQIAMRMPGEPWLWLAYHYVVCGGFLEGRRGWLASWTRAQYIAEVRAKMSALAIAAASEDDVSPAERCGALPPTARLSLENR